MRTITEAKAWREFAEWCAENPLAPHLCWMLKGADWDVERPTMTRWPVAEMLDRIRGHTYEGTEFSWLCLGCKTHPDDDYPAIYGPDARVVFCLLMELEAAESR